MKKILLLLAIIGLMVSCNSEPNTRAISYRMDVYENMTPPVIVVGRSDRVNPEVKMVNGKRYTLSGQKGTIVLQDATGTTVTFMDDEMYGNALHASYVKGDTLLSIIK